MSYARTHFCRGCDRPTRQTIVGHENTVKPPVDYYQCATDGLVLVTYADVADAEGFALVTLNRYLQGRTVAVDLQASDHDELLGHANCSLWRLYRDWDPGRGVRFRAYASGLLPHRIDDYVRLHHGDKRRGAINPLTAAVSLDALGTVGADGESVPYLDRCDPDRLGTALGARGGDTTDDRLAALRRVLYGDARGGARAGGVVGTGSDS